MNADGTGKTQITSDGFGKLNLDWGMTPAGSKIAYFGFLPSVSWSLITINPDGSGSTRMTGVSEALAIHSSTYAPDWSPNGTKILFSSYVSVVSGASLGCNVNDPPYDIFVYDTATNLVENLTSTPTWQGPHEASPVWSPDGTRIAMEVTFRTCVNGFSDYVRPPIYTMPATGGQLVKVTSPPSDGALHTSHFRPQWQPCLASTPNCISVTPPKSLVSITITPSAASVQVGSNRQFTATGGYSDSSTADLTGSVTWGSTDTAVATISGGGLAHGVGGGDDHDQRDARRHRWIRHSVGDEEVADDRVRASPEQEARRPRLRRESDGELGPPRDLSAPPAAARSGTRRST